MFPKGISCCTEAGVGMESVVRLAFVSAARKDSHPKQMGF